MENGKKRKKERKKESEKGLPRAGWQQSSSRHRRG
jgi:hypothetical protein